MFKVWQIFIFSLIPLALVFSGVIVGSFHGVDSEKEVFKAPPTAPPSTPGGGGTSPSAGGGGSITLTAKDQKFVQRTLNARPNTQVTVVMENQDAGVLHNFSVYQNNRATDKIFGGDTFAGPSSKSFTFSTPGPGNYYFRCDVHPETMNGAFSVR